MIKLKNWFIITTALAGIFLGITAGAVISLFHDLPQINSLKQFKPSAVSSVYSADNQVLAKFYIEKRFPVSIGQIPKHLIDALIATEDRNFYNHFGIDTKSISRAVIKDILAGHFKQGGSTLTQQLAKTLFLTPEKSIIRKLKEAILTLQIERRYTKDEILELYLNLIFFGSGAYGVEAASITYFDKNVNAITIGQAAMLAGLPKAPSRYSPLNNPDLAVKRKTIVLNQMLSLGKITQSQYEDALNEPFTRPEKTDQKYTAPYFVEYIKKSLKQHISLKHIYTKGLNIYTTLDLKLQKIAVDSVTRHMADLDNRMKKRNISSPYPQTALIAIDIKSGGIISMVGGRDFSKSSYNRATIAKRQPGSAFKPFVYACGIQKGLSQNELILDTPLVYQIDRNNVWTVNNFSKNFSGEMTLRKALSLSKNTCAVRLIDQLKPQRVIDFVKQLGIESELKPNLSLALGTSEVTLIELCAAYAVFANSGIWIKPFGIKKITDSKNDLLFTAYPEKRAVMSHQDAAIMTDMLKAVILEGTGKKASTIKKEIAGKTGTTDSYKDALFIGFSPDLAVGVWVGNDDSVTLGRYETGAKAALPIWIDYMKKYLKDKPYQFFDIPDGTKMVYMDTDTGEIFKLKKKNSVKALIRFKDE